MSGDLAEFSTGSEGGEEDDLIFSKPGKYLGERLII